MMHHSDCLYTAVISSDAPSSDCLSTLPGNCSTAAGNLVGLLLSPLILQHFGWRALFYIFGLVGAPLLLIWAALVPSQADRVASSEAAAAGGGGGSKVGVPQLLSKPATWAIIVTNFGE